MRPVCVLAIIGWLGCGGASAGLDLHFDAGSKTWSDITQRVADAPSPHSDSAPTIVAITANEPSFLVACDLAHNELWRSESASSTPPLVAGESVATVESGALVVRDLASGRRMFNRPLGGMSLLGVAREGRHLVFVAATPSILAAEPMSQLGMLNAETGTVLWERTLAASIGAPVLRNGVVLLPWNRQGLAAIDARNGRELARLHAPNISIDWIAANESVISYGNNEIRDLSCTTEATCTALPSPFVSAPSHPTLHPSGYDAPTNTRIHTVLSAARERDGSITLRDDRAYLVFYRYVFAFDARGELAWARLLNNDVLHAQDFAGGVGLIDASGQLTQLRASDGASLSPSNASSAQPLNDSQWQSATVAGTLHHTDNAEAPGEPPSSLQETLLTLVLDPDNRLVVARAFAAEQLARFEAPEVTQQLLDAYEQRSTPTGLKQVVAELLIARRTGAQMLIAALARHHDYLDSVTPPPLNVIVPALVAVNARDSVPALMAHLLDPATSPDDMLVIAQGLSRLGDRSLAPILVDWLRSMRASDALAGYPATVTSIANTARQLGANDALSNLRAIADAEHTRPVIAAAISEALFETVATTSAVNANADHTTEEAPTRFNQRAVNAAFADRVDALRQCIIPELARSPTLAQVRIAFVAQPDGDAHGFAFAPATSALAQCLNASVNGLRIAPFAGEAQVATYTIQVRSAAGTPESPTHTDETVAEWWSWYARETPPTDGAPWWQRYVEGDLDWLPVTITQMSTTPAEVAPAIAPTPAVTPPTPASTPASAPPTTPATTDETWWLPTQR